MLDLQRPLVYVSIESTGLDVEQDRVVELAMIKVQPSGKVGALRTGYSCSTVWLMLAMNGAWHSHWNQCTIHCQKMAARIRSREHYVICS